MLFCCCGCRCKGVTNFSKKPQIFCASGALMGGTCLTYSIDQPFAPCCCGVTIYMDIIDSGCYKQASSFFPKAISGSFDSVALKEGYVVCIYEKINFEGSPFVVAKGPIIINNSNWRSYYGSRITAFQNYRLTWSSENMYRSNRWQRPGSIAIGLWDGETEIEEKGFIQ